MAVTTLVPELLAGLGLGIALGSAPGPVQAVLLAESVRGGVARGFRAMAGANLTFGTLLVALALGLSVVAPTGLALRLIDLAGGTFLLWLAWDAFRVQPTETTLAAHRRQLPPAARGAIAVILNPGAWLFLGTAATSLFATAGSAGGSAGTLAAAFALLLGIVLGDGNVVLIGGIGLRRAGDGVGRTVRRALALVLGILGAWLLLRGLVP